MNIGLERPIGLEAGHTYRIRLVVDDTIGMLHVDGVALNVRMYERPGESLGVFATDGTVEVRNASIARGLKTRGRFWSAIPPQCATPPSPAD